MVLTIEPSDVAAVVTAHDRIAVELSPRSALSHVAWQLARTGEEAPGDDVDWGLPHSSEVEHRIVVPAGFAMPTLAPDRVRAIGTARFAEHQAIDGQALVVTFRFETGKPHLTAGERAALAAALLQLDAEKLRMTLPRAR